MHLLKHANRMALYHTDDGEHHCRRRLYQFHANKNQVSVYTLPTSNFCTCTFYQEYVLHQQAHYVCPHNLAIKLYEHVLSTTDDIDIEAFNVSNEYFTEKIARLFESIS
jgi:predicted nucleic acid-binding Zn finger protein